MAWPAFITAATKPRQWRDFVGLFIGGFAGLVGGLYLFILLVDPYHVVPFSLPLDRKIVSLSQAFVYPQIARSRRFDALIVGTSTSRLLDPEILNPRFGARFANLGMNSMTAFEQKTMVEYFTRHAGAPKVLVVGLDIVWCAADADRRRHNIPNWPDWLYDDNRWNDYLYLLNMPTLEIAVRLAGNRLGLYRERVRFDGFEVFTPAEASYDIARARRHIWGDRPEAAQAALAAAAARAESQVLRERAGNLLFPALAWLDETMAMLPAGTIKVLAFMPVHIAAQPLAGSEAAAAETECKRRIEAIARRTGSHLIDFRIASPITRDDANYWDPLHYRLPVAQRIARDIAAAVTEGRDAEDASYRILAR